MIKTQNGNVKKSKPLRLTGIYFTELKYPKLIPAIQKPITKTKNANGRLEKRGDLSIIFLRFFL